VGKELEEEEAGRTLVLVGKKLKEEEAGKLRIGNRFWISGGSGSE
jgi:hypothetical protein